MEKHNEHKNMLNDFSERLLHCLMWKRVPHVEDDLIERMSEIKPTEKGSNHVYLHYEMIEYHGIKEHQKIADYYNAKESIAYVLLNYNVVHVVLKKWWVRPKTCCRKNAGHERWETWEEDKEDQNRTDEARKEDAGEEGYGWRTRTPRTVLILGGKDVMSLLYATKQIVNSNLNCSSVRSSRPRPLRKQNFQPKKVNRISGRLRKRKQWHPLTRG